MPDDVGAPVVARVALQRLDMRALRCSRGRAERAATVRPRSLPWPTGGRTAVENRPAREAAGHHGPGRWPAWRLKALGRHAGRRRRARAERGPARGTPQLATQAIWSSTSPTTRCRKKRVPARVGDARVLIDTAPGGRGSGHARRCRLVGDPHLRNGVRDENVGAERRARPCRPPLRACTATGIPAASVATKAASSRDVPSSVVRADGFRAPCRSDLRAATGSFPSPSGTGGNDPRDWGQGGFLNWGQALRPISAIALHRDSAIAKTAFPQGKILGERRRNRGRSPL